jgi:hypothetical protein
MYKAKAAVCSEIRTKHSPQSENHVEILNVNPSCTQKTLGFKMLMEFCCKIPKDGDNAETYRR